MSEWKKVKFLDFIVLQRGFDLTKESIKEGPYPVVCSTSIMGYHNDYKVKGPGVVIGRSGTLGETQYIREDFWPHNTTLYVKDFKGNDRQYVYYFMKKFDVASMGGGAAIPSLNRNVLSNIVVSIPDISTQCRIATILSRYDSLIENYKKQIKLLEEAAQRLYKEWFVNLRFPGYENTKIVDGVPEGWEKKTIGDIVVYFDKQRKPLSSMQRMNMEKIYPYYGAAALMDYVDSYLFDGIYLLFGEDGTVITPDNFPVLQYVWGKFWVNNHAHVLRGKDSISTEFLYSMFKEMPIADVVTGAAQPKISQGRLSDKKILMPSLKLIQEWSCIAKHYFGRIRVITEQIRLLIEARDRLLPKLMGRGIEV